MSNDNRNQPEIDQALEIARKIREQIWFKNTELEKQLHGFLTVAQILGRANDILWSKSELMGYKDGIPLPNYRQEVQAKALIEGELQRTKNNIAFFDIPLVTGLSKIEEHILLFQMWMLKCLWFIHILF